MTVTSSLEKHEEPASARSGPTTEPPAPRDVDRRDDEAERFFVGAVRREMRHQAQQRRALALDPRVAR